MGTAQARKQRQIDAAHGKYAHCLLYLGMPPRLKKHMYRHPEGQPGGYDSFDWYNVDYRNDVRQFYCDVAEGTPPGSKAQKRFVRGYMRWIRRKAFEQEQDNE